MPVMEMRETASNQIGSFQAAIGETRIASFVSKSHRPGRKTPKAIKGKGRREEAIVFFLGNQKVEAFFLATPSRGEVSGESVKDERMWKDVELYTPSGVSKSLVEESEP